MATLKEIIYTIKNLKAGGVQSDDTKLSDANYADIVNYYRSKLIRQGIDRREQLDPMVIQPLYGDDKLGLEVERVVFNRGQPLSGKTVYRTVKKIPRAISTKTTNLVTFVGSNMLGKNFHRVTVNNASLMTKRAITGLEPKWFEFDERIYIITEDPLNRITIQLVAENPSKAKELNGEIDEFDPLNFEYPMSDTMRDSIFKLILDAELKVSSIGTDNINDGLEKTTNEN